MARNMCNNLTHLHFTSRNIFTLKLTVSWEFCFLNKYFSPFLVLVSTNVANIKTILWHKYYHPNQISAVETRAQFSMLFWEVHLEAPWLSLLVPKFRDLNAWSLQWLVLGSWMTYHDHHQFVPPRCNFKTSYFQYDNFTASCIFFVTSVLVMSGQG